VHHLSTAHYFAALYSVILTSTFLPFPAHTLLLLLLMIIGAVLSQEWKSFD
jgi:hypothetical protein